jgi:Protein of unknown function (DUF3176)
MVLVAHCTNVHMYNAKPALLRRPLTLFPPRMNARAEELSSLSRGIDSDDQSHFTIRRKPVNSDSGKSPHNVTLNGESDEQLRKPSQRHGRLDVVRRAFDYAWSVEIASCFLACAAFSAMVITVAIHQDEPLPQWPRLISVNSLIAIFSALLKAAILLPVAEGL